MKAILSFSLIFFLCLISYGQEVTVEEISSPVGGFYRQGYWHPVEIVLSSNRQGAEGKVELTAGKITFATNFDLPPQARRKLLLQVVFFDSSPSVSISVSTTGEKFSFPSVANEFQKTLTCVAPDKQLVAIIGDNPDESLSYLFKKEEIVTVKLACARAPTERFNITQFDVVVIGMREWVSLSVAQKDAMEGFVRSGGVVFIPQRPPFPIPPIDKMERHGLLVANQWGLGKVISPAAVPEYEKSLRTKDPQLKQDLLGILGLEEGRLHPNLLLASGAAELFESVPLFENFRINWFLILCIYISAALLGIGCAASGIWRVRYGISLFLLSVIATSLLFASTFPEEILSVTRCRILLFHSGARQARVSEIVGITSEYSPAVRQVDRVPLGKSGLLKPLFHSWSDYFRSETVVEQPSPALLRLSVSPLAQLLFQIDSDRRISGEIYFASDSAEQAVKVANRTGFELNDCLLIQQGKAISLGSLPSGKELDARDLGGKGFSLTELIANMKRAEDRKQRSRGAILSYAFRNLCSPETTYLVGWREDSAWQMPPAKNEVELWIVAGR